MKTFSIGGRPELVVAPDPAGATRGARRARSGRRRAGRAHVVRRGRRPSRGDPGRNWSDAVSDERLPAEAAESPGPGSDPDPADLPDALLWLDGALLLGLRRGSGGGCAGLRVAPGNALGCLRSHHGAVSGGDRRGGDQVVFRLRVLVEPPRPVRGYVDHRTKEAPADCP